MPDDSDFTWGDYFNKKLGDRLGFETEFDPNQNDPPMDGVQKGMEEAAKTTANPYLRLNSSGEEFWSMIEAEHDEQQKKLMMEAFDLKCKFIPGYGRKGDCEVGEPERGDKPEVRKVESLHELWDKDRSNTPPLGSSLGNLYKNKSNKGSDL